MGTAESRKHAQVLTVLYRRVRISAGLGHAGSDAAFRFCSMLGRRVCPRRPELVTLDMGKLMGIKDGDGHAETAQPGCRRRPAVRTLPPLTSGFWGVGLTGSSQMCLEIRLVDDDTVEEMNLRICYGSAIVFMCRKDGVWRQGDIIGHWIE